MFKNMIVYRIAEQWQGTLEQLEEALARTPFTECGATQERSAGWVAPRGEAEGVLAESIAGQWILRFMSESKMLPASVLNRKLGDKLATKLGRDVRFGEIAVRLGVYGYFFELPADAVFEQAGAVMELVASLVPDGGSR